MKLVEPPDPDQGAEIIPFEDLATVERLSVKDRFEPRACRHKRSTIDPVLRIVTCKDCDERLDPIEVLIDIARTWRVQSHHAQRIAEFEAKERLKGSEKRQRHVQRHVQRHMVCDGCGLESRKTVGQLTADDLAAWEQHFAIGHVPESRESLAVAWADGPRTYIVPAHTHRRRTPEDVRRRDLGLAPAAERKALAGITYVDRRPSGGPAGRPIGYFEDPDDQEGG